MATWEQWIIKKSKINRYGIINKMESWRFVIRSIRGKYCCFDRKGFWNYFTCTVFKLPVPILFLIGFGEISLIMITFLNNISSSMEKKCKFVSHLQAISEHNVYVVWKMWQLRFLNSKKVCFFILGANNPRSFILKVWALPGTGSLKTSFKL